MALTIGKILSERYKIQQLIPTGNVADLWIANDLILQRNVTIRIVKTEMLQNTHFLSRFSHEARVLAYLEHPHIVPIYDYGVFEKHPYQVQRYINTEITLTEWIQRRKSGTLTRESLGIAQQIASAIDYMHERQVVHRRLITPNILIDEQRLAYVINFALALAEREQPIEDKKIDNQYIFKVPELELGASYMSSGDIFAFGSILYQILTGLEPKFENGILINWAERESQGLPVGIDLVLRKLMLQDNTQRYQTATDAVDDLVKAFYSGKINIEGKIFISYARKDSEYVHKLASELRRIGLDIWIDQDIEPGSNWDEAIENGLNDCDMMLLITTDASMSSEYVTHEWSYFMGGGKPVYPFIPQEPIPTNIHPRLSRVQHVVGTDDMLNNVARIVDVLAGGTPSKLGGTENQG